MESDHSEKGAPFLRLNATSADIAAPIAIIAAATRADPRAREAELSLPIV